MSNFFQTSARSMGADPTAAVNSNAAFTKMFQDWRAAARTNPAPDSDGNKLGTMQTNVEVGSYLLTLPETLLDRNRGTRTVGMEFVGQPTTQIVYQPSITGYLFYNNDEVSELRTTQFTFDCNSNIGGCYYATSSGGAANIVWERCTWSGIWNYGIYLDGSNTNSEMEFNRCNITGDYTAGAFFNSQTSDQFLNYWWNQCAISVLTGTFCRMVLGGHIKINECDFSGYAGLVNPTLLFDLQGTSHAEGVCSFVDHGSRYEVGPNLQVMKSQWPAGIITHDSCDFSSQAFQSWTQSVVTHQFIIGNNAGPTILFNQCNLMGMHSYTSGSASYSMEKIIRYLGCNSESFVDIFSMFTTSVQGGAALGGLPPILIDKCRGKPVNWELAYPVTWQPSTVFAPGAIVRNNIWVYQTAAGGTSGTVPIYSAAPSQSDGTITDWVCLNIYQSINYVNDTIINKNKVTACPIIRHEGVFNDITGKWANRQSAAVPGACRVVLPPNVYMDELYFYWPAGSSSQGSPGTFWCQTDELSPTIFIPPTTTPAALSAGGKISWKGDPYFTGTGTGRAIVWYSGTDVTNAPGNDGKQLGYAAYT